MTRIEEVSEDEIGRRYGEKEYIDAMQYVQSTDFFDVKKQKLLRREQLRNW